MAELHAIGGNGNGNSELDSHAKLVRPFYTPSAREIRRVRAFEQKSRGLSPLYRSVRRWQDRAKALWLPLFPCYVFIREGMDRQLQILTTPGVIHIVKWGGRPAIVPKTQLNAVRQIVESCPNVETHPYLQSGDRVRVKSGPLMGLEGIWTRKKGVARLVVSMEMLGRSAAVEIDILNVERIGPIPAPNLLPRISASA